MYLNFAGLDSTGLTVAEAAKVCNYCHFREPIKLQEKSLLQRANLDKSIDFMDAVDEDVPKGKILEIYMVGL